MLQIPLSDLAVAPGHVLEWMLHPPAARPVDPAARHASYNQEKHFAAAVAARAENAPEKNWVAVTFELPGRVDVTALERAVELFVRRHEVLRCAFDECLGGELRCHVIQPDDVRLDRIAVGGFDTTEDTRAYLGKRFNETINTLSWPLFLVGAVVGTGVTTVYLAFDHIVCDGMSLVMAVEDLWTAYHAVTRGVPVELPPVGSYIDFGNAQRARYTSMTADGPELAYWRRFIAHTGDFFPRVPLDFGVADGELYPAVNETTKLLDDAGASAFERACRAHGGKLFMGILASVGMALGRVGGIDTYRGLMPVGERRDPAWRQAFGWFVNTMPIEFAVSPDRDFPTVLSGVRDAFGEMIANVDTPFIKAWELLAPHYYQLRMWPFPVSFFSFLDFRKLPGAAHHARSRPRTIPEASHSNTGNMWFFRNADGVYLNTIFPDTVKGHRAMSAYRAAIAGVLDDLVATAPGATPAARAA